jgi:hypothetical protein
VTYEIVSAPAQATVMPGSTGPFRLLAVDADAAGEDALRFRVVSPGGTSTEAVVRLLYDEPVEPGPPEIVLASGRIVDKGRRRRDRIEATGTLPLPQDHDAAAFDPAASSLRVELGDVGHPLVLDVEAGSTRWKFKRGTFRWKAKRNAKPRLVLRFDPETGAFELSVKKADFAAPHQSPIRVLLAIGTLSGGLDAAWQPDPDKPANWRFTAEP